MGSILTTTELGTASETAVVPSEQKVEPLPKYLPMRFLAKTRYEGDCVIWTGSIGDGYGLFRFRGRTVRAYRFAYEVIIGSVPENEELDHLCRNRACVYPQHLEAVSHLENMKRGQIATKTHCVAGHVLAGRNLKVYGGRRYCLTCKRRRSRTTQRKRVTSAA